MAEAVVVGQEEQPGQVAGRNRRDLISTSFHEINLLFILTFWERAFRSSHTGSNSSAESSNIMKIKYREPRLVIYTVNMSNEL